MESSRPTRARAAATRSTTTPMTRPRRRAAAAARMFIRRHLRPLRLGAGHLPRDCYNTAVRERFERILQEQLHGESVEFTVRINESTTARVHFVVHCPRATTSPTSTPPSWSVGSQRRPLLARRLHAGRDRGVRRGGRHHPRPALRRVLPRGLQGGLHRRAPPRSTSAGSRRSAPTRPTTAASTSRSTSTSTPARARPAEGLPDRRPALALRGAADALVDGRRGRRRAALRARGARARSR